jgi:sugar/nucleoside kinase (ribokinase family)
MVWDRIHAREGRAVPVEEWGGITYALAAAAAARPPDWTIVPVMKVGRDLEERAWRFLRELPGFDCESGLRIVPEPNNRVELRYQDMERRTEQMSGGVPPWQWEELQPIVAGLDALYINFISGFELSLETATRLRAAFDGPIYADLHSLFLGIDAAGWRSFQPLAAWREWLRCFDIVQVNEPEMDMLASAWGDPWHLAAEVVGPDLRLLVVTLGSRGAACIAAPDFGRGPLSWKHDAGRIERVVPPAAARSQRFTLAPDTQVDGDPTGCGDVWGATCFCRMLAGRGLEDSVRAALDAAARNVRHRGATGLHHHLSGRIVA